MAQRPDSSPAPPGDIIRKTRAGAILIVHCDEKITGELYTGTEFCDYVVGNSEYKLW